MHISQKTTSHAPPTGANSLGFDWLMALLSLWTVFGLFLDGWAHNAFTALIDTFFTPWHAVLYSGVAAMGAALLALALVRWRQGVTWRHVLPPGYHLAGLGFGLFCLAGLGDFAWHTALGFEVSVEALLSPPHLVLAIGGVLLTGGPLWAAWCRPDTDAPRGWRTLGPVVCALLAVLSIATFFTQYANPFTNTSLVAGPRQTQGRSFLDETALSGVIIFTGVLMTSILLTLQRWSLPRGALTCLLGLNAGLMFVLGLGRNYPYWPVLPAALLAGLWAEILLALLRPTVQRVHALRVFAFAAPWGLYVFYFAALLVCHGLRWRIHMWLGAPCLAGLAGVGLSMLLAPPGRHAGSALARPTCERPPC